MALLHPPFLIHRTIPGRHIASRKFSPPAATCFMHPLPGGPPPYDAPANLRQRDEGSRSRRAVPSGRTSPGHRRTSSGGHHPPCTACCSRNGRTRPGRINRRQSRRTPE
ncbi:hypothetical protein [Methanoculleus chikugoensis]|uniref:hypothetical protein n=1 Tax=Methanoculleus chikugoensis TaxID=118126 RepID=UPI000B1E455B|nr:hypothetical protein [Methanoculleus chikugoensis]